MILPFLLFLCVLPQVTYGSVTANFSANELSIQMGQNATLEIILSNNFTEDAQIFMTYQASTSSPITANGTDEVIQPLPILNVTANSSESLNVLLIARRPGSLLLGINSTSPEFLSDSRVYAKISVVNSHLLELIQIIIGWIYFFAWTVSFYPQLILNFQRKCVVGFSLDFIAYNIIGFISYSVFNVALFWIEPVRKEYFDKNPRSVVQVQLNDVVFSLHAVAIVALQIIQCFIYDRGNQRISRVCYVLISGMLLFIFICLILTLTDVLTWLTYVTYFSFVKLFVTLIKYIPQAWLNFKRKSTIGWSIVNVLLDFTGGSLSILQMFLVAYNSDDWYSLFGDFTKFGLGAFSIAFDVLFIVQHFCLYRHSGKEPLATLEVGYGDEDEDDPPTYPSLSSYATDSTAPARHVNGVSETSPLTKNTRTVTLYG